MARAEAIATSDSEDEKPTTARGGAAGKSNRSKTKREPTPEQSEGEDGGSDDEPEYEIEAILDHKSGVVKQVRSTVPGHRCVCAPYACEAHIYVLLELPERLRWSYRDIWLTLSSGRAMMKLKTRGSTKTMPGA
jgi:hypothetical protein